MNKLIGHSGCEVLLICENGISKVRKISKDIEYNHRLKLQCEKQKKFKDSVILAPKVYSQGYIKELFYFDMEYVNGIKFNDFIKNNSFIYVKSYFLQLITFILNNFNNENKNFEDIILDKINHIAKTNLIDNQIIETMKINSKKEGRKPPFDYQNWY